MLYIFGDINNKKVTQIRNNSEEGLFKCVHFDTPDQDRNKCKKCIFVCVREF